MKITMKEIEEPKEIKVEKWHDILIEEEDFSWCCEDDISSLFTNREEIVSTGSMVWR